MIQPRDFIALPGGAAAAWQLVMEDIECSAT